MSEKQNIEPGQLAPESLPDDKRLLIEAARILSDSKIPLFLERISKKLGFEEPYLWPDPEKVRMSRHSYSRHEKAQARLIWDVRRHKPGFFNRGLRKTYYDLNAVVYQGTDEIEFSICKIADRRKTEFEYPEGKELYRRLLSRDEWEDEGRVKKVIVEGFGKVGLNVQSILEDK